MVYDANAEVRKVENFTGVEVSSAISLYLSQGNENALAISVDKEHMDKIKTEVKNGVLKIYVESGLWNKWNWSNKKIKAYVTIKTIEKLSASGASSVTITDKLTAGNLKINVNGASNLKGDIQAQNIDLNISGAATATISGTTGGLTVDARGASNLKASELVASECSAQASGASSIRVNVTKEFSKVEASGASSIRYRGEATVKNFEASGASSIKKDNSK